MPAEMCIRDRDGERMKELGEISLRMVKILLENGNLEVLATNL